MFARATIKQIEAGTASISGSNCLYTPHPGFEGVDSFTFTASDGVWTSSSPATVTIYVVAGPTNLTAECNTNGPGVLLNWRLDAAVQEMEVEYGFTVASFEIYRSTVPGVFTTNDIIYTTSDATQTNYLDLGVVPGTTNYYAVDFINDEYNPPTYEQITYRSSFSNVVTNVACLPPPSGAMDVVFIIDNTGSMGESIAAIQDAVDNTLDYIVDASDGNYRLALVTPDLDNDGWDGNEHDMVDVRVSFSQTNRVTFESAVNALFAYGGGDTPESTDQCLNTVVNALLAAGRTNDDECMPASPLLQTNNFSPAFRTNAVKLAVLITDASPSGFCDGAGDYTTNSAHLYALEASTNHIHINAIQIDDGTADENTQPVMQDYAATSCGWYADMVLTYDPTLDDQNIEDAILNIIYTPNECNQ